MVLLRGHVNKRTQILPLPQIVVCSSSNSSPTTGCIYFFSGPCKWFNRLMRGTVSNAFCTSKKTIATSWLLSTALHQSSNSDEGKQFESTLISPFFLMSGRRVHKVIDPMYVQQPIPVDSDTDLTSEYARNLKMNFQEAYTRVHVKMGHKLARQKDIYDQKVDG